MVLAAGRGFRQSSLGREPGLEGLRACLEPRSSGLARQDVTYSSSS